MKTRIITILLSSLLLFGVVHAADLSTLYEPPENCEKGTAVDGTAMLICS